jgi:suppressor for copper-sensitivity B
MLNRFILRAIAVVFGLGFHSSALLSQAATTPAKPDFTAQLIVGGADKADPALAWLGLHVRLGPGWHTYWRAAGDAGAPPEFDWSRSQNLAAATVEWPAPHRYSDAGIDTFGYGDEVLFPIKLRLQDPLTPAHVSLKLALYVCGTICTRNEFNFDAEIVPGVRSADQLSLIDGWRTKVPRPESPDMKISSVRLDASKQLRIDVTSASPLVAPDVFVDGDSAIAAGHPTIAAGAAEGAAVITLPVEGADATHPDKPLRITLVDGARAVEAVLPPQPSWAGRATPSTGLMLAVALLGGLILNFMPCVFPVLSLKLFSLLGPSSDVGAIRTRFLASAAGVISSFLVLAVVLAVLRSIGAEIGWGIQFQQPFFLIGMAAILVALGANLLDLYEIRLPWRLASLFGRGASSHSIASHFFNGFVLTLLATPCSAPFVGTAVGFALSQGTWEIVEIFAALGLGMSSPYLLLAAVPLVGRFFPRPGRWMLAIRYFAAVAMVGTAIWLLTVLAEISGVQTALVVGASFGLIVWVLALRRQRFAHIVAGGLMAGLAGVAFLMAGGRPSPASEQAANSILWQPLAPQKIAAMVQNGHTVFVDVGAAWCVTCKVNEALIINSPSIRQRLATDVAPVQGDWTRPDPKISAYLQSFGRFGLPFNVVFGPGAPEGIVLPELLSQDAILKAFDTASNQKSSL